MVNVEYILNQQHLESLDEKYSKRQRQEYTKYANPTIAGLIQHLYDDYGTISPMEIEESEQKMKNNGRS